MSMPRNRKWLYDRRCDGCGRAGGSGGLAEFPARSWPLDLSALERASNVALDRDGQLLRAFETPDGRWRLPVRTNDVDPRFFALLKAYEDKRFDRHHGVDFSALLRAAWQYVRHGHAVSGGSTLTMQAARLLEPRPERTFLAKARQIFRAYELERRFTKSRFSTCIWRWRLMAAISKACAPPRWPISARSRAASVTARRRCSSRCHRRRRRVGPTARPPRQKRRATGCSTAPSRQICWDRRSAHGQGRNTLRWRAKISPISRRTPARRFSAPIPTARSRI